MHVSSSPYFLTLAIIRFYLLCFNFYSFRHSHRHEIWHSSNGRNDGSSSGLSDREKRRRHDSPHYRDRSHPHQRHSDDYRR